MPARYVFRDPSHWEDPELYNPGRFLVPAPAKSPDPLISYGYGRQLVLAVEPTVSTDGLPFSVSVLANIFLKKQESLL